MQLYHEEPPTTEALQPYVNRRLHTRSESDIDFCMALPPTGAIYLTFVYGDEMTLQFGDADPEMSPRLFVGARSSLYARVQDARSGGVHRD
ncbi:hypothetical protein [Thiohalomonas denitrificans]|uniref:hypothetical protein n=1 Tax=Thiohalomonas denitrificans TaxID=415747 RepID=UPI000B87B7B1|nr:hypothetical protein [Thiohalomonas denitrificans]